MLDYTHRKDDGSVVKVADSLIHEFKTKDGRSVYDGSGIYPDIFVKQEHFASVMPPCTAKSIQRSATRRTLLCLTVTITTL
jgi:carboxyl-terminal processing protease